MLDEIVQIQAGLHEVGCRRGKAGTDAAVEQGKLDPVPDFHQVGVGVVIATYDGALFNGARRIVLDHGTMTTS